MDRHTFQSIGPEARGELDRALGHWQRGRAALSCLVAAALFALSAGTELAGQLHSDIVTLSSRIDLGVAVLLAVGYVLAAWRFRTMPPVPWRVARFFGWVLMVAGAIAILGAMLVLAYDTEFWGPEQSAAQRAFASAGTALAAVFLIHFLGSLFVALPPWHALWPLLPLWLLYAGCTVALDAPLEMRLILAGLFPLAGIPGLLWSVWGHERFVTRFLGGRYGELRRDLAEARRVHEALFPRPIESGPLRMRFRYEPMREVGGDLLFVRGLGPGRLLAVVVDVTGHGVSSALAVTRIHAVLVAMSGSAASAEPGAILAGLNAFVHDELAPQGIFATAAVVAVDAAGRLRWASAGHPPALLRRTNGRVEDLPSTAPLLGALPPEEFAPAPRETGVACGDVVVLCTDGVLEAEDAAREQFGAGRLRAAVAAAPTAIASRTMDAVRSHRAGAAVDDTLVVEIELG